MRSSDACRCALGTMAVVVMLMLGLATSAAAQAQAGSGQVVGTSYDSTGAVVPETKVTLNSKATGLTREETSNDEGQYRFVLVPIGFYSVSFSKGGFKTYKVDVEVTVGAAVTVNARLEVGEVSQVIQVTATALIESTQANPDALIGVRAIEELPINGRRFQDFVTLTPTVQIEPARSGISFAGQRGINGNVTIDGADYNEPFFGGMRGGERSNNAFSIPQESISQFQVVSSGYSVEFGRSSGGILNATTKSGTNDIHGSAFFFVRNGALALKDGFFRDAITTLYQEGGSIGGRISRDKLFFFAAFENQKNDNPHSVVFSRLDNFTPAVSQLEGFCFYRATTGCPSGLAGQEGPYTQTNDAMTGLGRLDIQPNASHRIFFRYNYSKNTGLNAVSTGNAIQPTTDTALSGNGVEGDRVNTGVAQWTVIFSPRAVMESRFQYSLENRPRLSNTTIAGLFDTVGITGATSFLPTTLDDYRIQGSSSMTWTQGRHAVKFGGEYNFLHVSQFFKFNQFGVYNISGSDVGTVLQILNPAPSPPFPISTPPTAPRTCNPNNSVPTVFTNPVRGRFDCSAASYRVNLGNGLVAYAGKQVAAFIQDTWRISPRVTLTAGFRWEGYVNPQPDVSNTAIYNEVKNLPFPIGRKVDPAFIPSNYRQYMPRVGLAWDPRGDAKTVIRANAGFFYAPTPLLLYANSLNAFRATPGDVSVFLPLTKPTGFTCPALYPGDQCATLYSQLRHIGIDLNSSPLTGLPTITPANVTAIAAFLGLTPSPFNNAQLIATANNYESPRSWQWSVGMERELTKGWSVGADFMWVSTVHLQRNIDINLPAPVICDGSPGSRPPCLAGAAGVDLSLRPCFGVAGTSACRQNRPISTANGFAIPLSSLTLRETTGRSFYRAMTIRSNFRRSRYQFQAFYTLGYNYSDDDNERSATGFNYDNPFNLRPEFGFSLLDVRHLFLVNGLVDLPWGFTVSALGKFRSARPVDPVIGSIQNGAESSGSFGDRAFQAPGVPFQRNSFRDRRVYSVDMRIAKKFKLPREGMSLAITADFFNLFNFDNVTITGGSSGLSGFNRNYGVGVNRDGTIRPANPTFLRIHDPAACLPVNPKGNPSCFDTNTFPNGNGTVPPFTVQLGIRFQF